MTTQPKPQRILVIAALVSSLVMLDSNVVAVALPAISRSLHASFTSIQWVITSYVLPFAALLLASGSFADIVGRKRAVLLGQGIFALASLLCGMAESGFILNLSRAMQGVGASLLLTAALAIINDTFRGAERARAYAFWGSCLGITITCSPTIGGLISSVFGWKWVFFVNLPICFLLIFATLREIPESRDPTNRKLDIPGIALSVAGLFLLTWAVIDGNSLGWGSSVILWRALGGALLLAGFVIVEIVQQKPMVDFGLLRTRQFAGSAFAMAGYAGGAQVMIFYLPLYLQCAFSFGPLAAGIGMLPFALPMFVAPRIAARFSRGANSHGTLATGLALSVIANGSLALQASYDATYGTFALAMLLAGTGAGILNGETAKALQASLPAERSGMASGLSATVRFTALLFGVAGLGAVLISVAAANFLDTATILRLDSSSALGAIKLFCAGDLVGAQHLLSNSDPGSTKHALTRAFESGFGAAAWAASAIAAACLFFTRALLVAPSRTVSISATPREIPPGE